MSKLQELINRLCPNGVEFKPLGEVCEIRGRIGFRGYTRKDIVPEKQGAISLSPSNIVDNRLLYDNSTYISWDKYNESPEIIACNNDVVFTKTASVGKCAIIKGLPCEATINPQLVILKNITTNPDYLNYILQGSSFQSEVKKFTGIGSVPNISQSALAQISIPVPPLEVQEEIVKILDRFADYSAELQAELQARKEQYEYYRNLLLTFNPSAKGCGTDDEQEDSVTTWGGHSYTVAWKTMGEIARIYSGSNKQKLSSGKFPVYGSTGIIAYCNKPIYMKQQILIARVGANAGFTHLTNSDEYDVSDNTLMVDLNEIYNLKFIFYYLVNCNLNRLAKGGGQPLITASEIKKIPIPVLPIELQEKIVAILDRFEALVNDLSQGLPAEIAAVKEQYEYYRNKLLTFKQLA